jgi:stage III sporulation protein AH
MDEASKESAISSYVALNDNIEKESDAETLLFARGFEDAIVTISDDYVDVALSVESVDDTTRAQIEDIVTRKTGYDVSQVVISVAGSK